MKNVNHFAIRQSLAGRLSFLEPFAEMGGEGSRPIHHLIRVLASTPSVMEFYTYSAERQQFEKTNFVTELNDMIVDLKALDRVNGQPLLFIQTYNAFHNTFKQFLFGLTREHNLKVLFEKSTADSFLIDTIVVNNEDFIAVHSKVAKSIDIYSISEQIPDNFKLTLSSIIEKKSVKQIKSLDANLLLILTENKLVELFAFNTRTTMFDQKLALSVLNPSQMTVVRFKGHYFVAVYCLGDSRNPVAFGAIEVFVLSGNEAKHFQTVADKTATTLALRFAVLTSDELVLYVLTSNPASPIIVYQYSGIAGFTELIGTSIAPIGSKLATVELRDVDKNFAMMLTADETLIIEAVIQ